MIKQQNRQRREVELEIKESDDSICNATIIIYYCVATLNDFKKLVMEFKIEGERPFKKIQEKFNDIYPYLKIEDSRMANTSMSGHLKKMNQCSNSKLKESSADKAFIIINDLTTVADLVNQFCENLDLPVRVLRKSNNHWIETSLTDSWTLEKQNMAGKQFSES